MSIEEFDDQKNTKSASSDGENKYKLATQNPIVGIAWCDKNGFVIDANKAFCKILNYNLEELKKLHFSTFTHPDDLVREHPLITQILEGKINHYKIEKRFLSREGTIVWVELNLSCHRDESGEIKYIIGIIVDITTRKKAEKDLFESREKFRLVTENPLIGICWTTKEGAIFDSNQSFQEMTGYGSALNGMHISLITHPEDFQREKQLINQIINGESAYAHFNKRYISKNNQIIWAEVSITCYTAENAEYLIAIIQNINAKKEAEAALIQSKEQYRFLTEIVPQIFWTAKPDGGLDFYNSRFYEYSGMSFEAAKEWGWEQLLHPNDLPRITPIWKNCLQNIIPYEAEFRIRKANDNEYRWHLVRALPLKSSDGTVIKWFGTATDIHEQKGIAESMVNANQKLIKINNDLDNFVYTASHDLKSPVSNIEGLLMALKGILPDSYMQIKDVPELLNMITLSTQKLKDTIQDLSTIGRTQRNLSDDVELVKIYEIIDDIKILLLNEIESTSSQIILQLDEHQSLRFSRNDLKSILYNLILNSIKYRNPNHALVIEITTTIVDEYICLSVKDNGLGIPEHKRDYIFGMFKRHHIQVPGSGIGLYIVKRIMDNNDGKIEVDSEEGKWTIFKIYFKIS